VHTIARFLPLPFLLFFSPNRSPSLPSSSFVEKVFWTPPVQSAMMSARSLFPSLLKDEEFADLTRLFFFTGPAPDPFPLAPSLRTRRNNLRLFSLFNWVVSKDKKNQFAFLSSNSLEIRSIAIRASHVEIRVLEHFVLSPFEYPFPG